MPDASCTPPPALGVLNKMQLEEWGPPHFPLRLETPILSRHRSRYQYPENVLGQPNSVCISIMDYVWMFTMIVKLVSSLQAWVGCNLSRRYADLSSSAQRLWCFYRVGATTGACPTHHYCVRDEHTRLNLGLSINAASWERQEAARLR